MSSGAAGAKKVRWTPEQRRGVETTGRSLLVSAAAGSGKTAVLAARCAHLVCEAKPPCDVDQLLVVTFTEAAAAEMKGRIERALRDKLANADDPRLARQLAIVERAHVSTLHGFCSRLLRQNFHVLGLDPGFSMLDADEGKLLRIEVVREMFAERYEKDADGAFGRFVRCYASGNDEGLIPHVIRTHEMLCSIVEPREWLKGARERIARAAEGSLEESELGRELVELLAGKVDALRRRCADAIAGVSRMEGLGKYVAFLGELANLLDDWRDRLEQRGVDGLAEAIAGYDPPPLPRMKSDTPGKSVAMAAIDAVRDEMKDGSLHEIARFSSTQWQEGLARVAPMANVFLGLVEEFARRYRRAKDQTRRLDFNDLERYALKVLRDPEAKGLVPSGVARTLHRQFHHVLVDEYQDINEVQDAILHLVSRECVEGDGAVQNLFCVGDVKQSIYRFRLAEPERFLQRYERFREGSGVGVQGSGEKTGEVIDLQANFRSRAPLLGVINEVFARLMTAEAADIHYDQTHALRPGATFPEHAEGCFVGSPVELHLLPEDVQPASEEDEALDRSEREAAFVARRIHQLMGAGGGCRMSVMERTDAGMVARPIQYRDIVILLRSMKVRADSYADVLSAAGIPVFREGGQGYFDSMEVRDFRSLLSLLDNPQQDIPMAAVLRSPLAGLAQPEDCLARIRLAYRGGREGVPFHQAVVKYAAEQDDELAARLRDFLQTLEHWRDLARHRPLAEMIWAVYDQTGYLAFCEGLANGPQRVANLVELHERAAQFGSFSRQGLYRFLKFLDSLEAETDFGQPSVLNESADVVRVMSVHHSKGLEFPVVFLPELGKKFNLSDTHGALLLDKRKGLALSAVDEAKRIRYPSLASVLVRSSLRRQSLAEELRVLYVAMTRAKEHLILSGTCSDKARARWRTLWPGHVGPMPAQDVLEAGSMLDWVGPVVTMAGEGSFAVTEHAAEEVAAWTGAELKRPTLSPLQQKMANLEPMHPAPSADARAGEIVASLTAAYPHRAMAHVEAARSVVDWTKEGRREVAVGYVTAAADRTISLDRTLATPKCLLAADELSATDVGSATHLVLQHLDFARACAGEDLREQLAGLVERRVLAPGQARVVDLAAIEWFVESELGRFVCGRAADLRREMAFYLAVDPPEVGAVVDPMDRVMIRGRIDAAVVEADGLTLIDYKTDRVAPERVGERAEAYREQVGLYRRAMEAVAGRGVKRVCLVFLSPRIIVEM